MDDMKRVMNGPLGDASRRMAVQAVHHRGTSTGAVNTRDNRFAKGVKDVA